MSDESELGVKCTACQHDKNIQHYIEYHGGVCPNCKRELVLKVAVDYPYNCRVSCTHTDTARYDECCYYSEDKEPAKEVLSPGIKADRKSVV